MNIRSLNWPNLITSLEMNKKLMKEFFLYFAGNKNWICLPRT